MRGDERMKVLEGLEWESREEGDLDPSGASKEVIASTKCT
jgi:hypothetical protein